MELFFVIWLICGIAAGAIASGKGRSAFGWFLLGFLLGPLGLLAAAVMSPDQATRDQRDQRAALQSGTGRRCPMCAEVIQAAAIKCRFCGADLAEAPES